MSEHPRVVGDDDDVTLKWPTSTSGEHSTSKGKYDRSMSKFPLSTGQENGENPGGGGRSAGAVDDEPIGPSTGAMTSSSVTAGTSCTDVPCRSAPWVTISRYLTRRRPRRWNGYPQMGELGDGHGPVHTGQESGDDSRHNAG